MMERKRAKPIGYPILANVITSDVWFYEEPKGIEVHIYKISRSDHRDAVLPWRKLEAAVDRHRAIKAAKAEKKSA